MRDVTKLGRSLDLNCRIHDLAAGVDDIFSWYVVFRWPWKILNNGHACEADVTSDDSARGD